MHDMLRELYGSAVMYPNGGSRAMGQYKNTQANMHIPMGRNASSSIADLYSSWDKACSVSKISKNYFTTDKHIPYNCRHLDLKGLGDIANDIYDNTLILEACNCSH